MSGYQEENEELHGGNYRIAAIGGYSNWCSHPNVHGYEKNLKEAVQGLAYALIDRGAKVSIVELPDGPAKGLSIAPHWQDIMRSYYTLMGWDPETGMPLPDTLRDLGLEDMVRDV